MIYWKLNSTIYIHKSNEGLKYEIYILFIHVLAIKVFLFTNHMFKFIFPKNRH
jgi:hypothetical protein